MSSHDSEQISDWPLKEPRLLYRNADTKFRHLFGENLYGTEFLL